MKPLQSLEVTALPYIKETRDLYTRLKDAGYDPPWVRKHVLPEWWEDKMARNPVMRAQAEIILSRFLGVAPSVLAEPERPIETGLFEGVRFKRMSGNETKDLGPAYRTIRRAAEITVRCLDDSVRRPELLDVRPHHLRRSFLNEGDLVSFERLLDASWSLGVPVVRVARLPPGSGQVIDGAALEVDGRPVIVITTHRTSSGFLAWILAHEMGHVARGHLRGGPIFDAKIMQPARGEDGAEDEANEFAALLVFGEEAFEPSTSYWPDGERLALMAKRYGHEHRIDPPVIVTAWARSMQRREDEQVFWGIATNALKALGADFVEGSTLRDRMRRFLNSSALSDSDAHFFAEVTGLGPRW